MRSAIRPVKRTEALEIGEIDLHYHLEYGSINSELPSQRIAAPCLKMHQESDRGSQQAG